MGKLVPTPTLVVTPLLQLPSWHSAHVQNGAQSRPVPLCRCRCRSFQPWEPITFIFRGYNPYFGGLTTLILHGFGVQGNVLIPAQINNQRETLGSLGRVPQRYIYICTPTYTTQKNGLDNGCKGQYGVIFREQLLGYPPKGTHRIPCKQQE